MSDFFPRPVQAFGPIKPPLLSGSWTQRDPVGGAAPANFSAVDGNGVLTAQKYGDANHRGLFYALPAAPYKVQIGVMGTTQFTSYNAGRIALIDPTVAVAGTLAGVLWSPFEYGTAAFGTIRSELITGNWANSGGVRQTIPATVTDRQSMVWEIENDSTNIYISYYPGGSPVPVLLDSDLIATFGSPTEIGIIPWAQDAAAALGSRAQTSISVWHYDDTL